MSDSWVSGRKEIAQPSFYFTLSVFKLYITTEVCILFLAFHDKQEQKRSTMTSSAPVLDAEGDHTVFRKFSYKYKQWNIMTILSLHCLSTKTVKFAKCLWLGARIVAKQKKKLTTFN